MVLLRAVKWTSGLNRGVLRLRGRLPARHGRCNLGLRVVVIEDGGAVLRAREGTRHRVVHLKEALEHALRRHHTRVEGDTQGLCVIANRLVGRIGGAATAVANHGLRDPGESCKLLLGVPESAERECERAGRRALNGLGQPRANGRAHGGGPTARRLAEEGEARARGSDGGQHPL
eukprot:CAMPEP_0185500598 /NCGR_PEP_ID=MMETSP1366-20130426/23857_1 /TAXON_ID=38817 /ORGANISM="Gephyrocapsa oceanica, Strain RCC1303" /LENGTH=174 /DNA_ID=CAMNT_0028109925 /DNA_START=258 /DNA_END=778 /DNA_ORIENTATION=-